MKMNLKNVNFQNNPLSQISAKRAKKVQNLKFYFSRIFLDRHAKIFYYIKNMLRQVSFLVAFYMPNNCVTSQKWIFVQISSLSEKLTELFIWVTEYQTSSNSDTI